MTTFEDQRGKLFAIAYRMVGSAMDAEDIVQDAWLRYQKLTTPLDNPSAFLRKIVTNLSLDYLKSAKVQREQYIGEWLPEPIATDTASPSDALNKAETISVAFLVVLETLSPLERAVFILREAFDYDYKEIASILEKSESTCRKIFSRAKKHIHSNRPRFDATPEAHTRLVNHFIAATQHGDVNEITAVLAEDVALYSDGGGKVAAAIRPLYGRDKILRFLLGLHKRASDAGIVYENIPIALNGEQGMISRMTETGEMILAATFEIHQEQIVRIRFVRNPDKLATL
jgi:RNA polymerase sigma-70 factor, ECF subfamily